MKINPNILNEGNHMEVLEYNDDEMKMIVRCNNCGKPTEYGKTRMCSGFVGCDNKIKVNGKEVECYFEDLMPRVIYAHDNQTQEYKTGKIYRWRDNVDGGIDDKGRLKYKPSELKKILKGEMSYGNKTNDLSKR